MSDKNYSDHVHEPYNRRANMKLGFTEEEYDEFCRTLVEVYEENKSMSIASLCKWAEENFDVDLYWNKCRNILLKYNANIREHNKDKAKKRKKKQIIVSIDPHIFEFFNYFKQEFEGFYMAREYIEFIINMSRGEPTKHLCLWLSEFRTTLFMWDKKLLRYHVIGEDISDVEADVINELLAQVEEQDDLGPVKAFAREKGLMCYGGNYDG